jgi:large subunit ribosomal protein L21
MKPKKKTRKKRGHRQELTRLMIDSIGLNGTVIASVSAEAETTATPAPESSASESETQETTKASAKKK